MRESRHQRPDRAGPVPDNSDRHTSVRSRWHSSGECPALSSRVLRVCDRQAGFRRRFLSSDSGSFIARVFARRIAYSNHVARPLVFYSGTGWVKRPEIQDAEVSHDATELVAGSRFALDGSERPARHTTWTLVTHQQSG